VFLLLSIRRIQLLRCSQRSPSEQCSPHCGSHCSMDHFHYPILIC
jgi:hypothetical protein